MSEAAKEIKFVHQILLSIGMKVKTPITVRVDNVGAIFMAENVAVSQRTKHVDIRYKFLREMVQDRFLRIIFVKSAENVSDVMTKNTTGETHRRHEAELVEPKGGHETHHRKGVGQYGSSVCPGESWGDSKKTLGVSTG